LTSSWQEKLYKECAHNKRETLDIYLESASKWGNIFIVCKYITTC